MDGFAVNTTFDSHDDARGKYEEFARKTGFSVRLGTAKKEKDGTIRKRDFLCHREGETPSKGEDDSKKTRNRESTRCKCKAMLRVSKQANGRWKVLQFSNEHNHDLLTPTESALLAAYRGFNEDQRSTILLLRSAGLRVPEIYNVLNKQYRDVTWIKKDIGNLIESTSQKGYRSGSMDDRSHREHELSREECTTCFNNLMQYSREICKKASEGDRDTYINTKNALKALLKTLYATPNEKEPEQTTEDYPTTTNTAESDNSEDAIHHMEDICIAVKNPPKSNTKGRKKETRRQSAMEQSLKKKKPRTCKMCKGIGHDSRNCPTKSWTVLETKL